MPALKNKKHEAFARNIGIKGMSAAEAYRTVFPDASRATSEVNGSRLAAKFGLRISEFREESAERAKEKDFLSVEEKRAFLAKIVRTPIGEVDEKSDLCQEFGFDIVGGGVRGRLKRGSDESGNEIEEIPRERLKFKMPSKLDAIKIDNDLANDGSLAVGNKAVADALPDLSSAIRAVFGRA